MTADDLAQILLLLGAAVAVILAFQRLHIPTSLGYLLVGVLLGPHTAGPVVDGGQIRVIAELGIVFLLFTIGLNYSLPQIYALRHLVLGLGTAQVALTTLVVGALAWLAGLSLAAAFVVGAVFAQSSTTIIVKQLADQGEENTRHGKLGTAMSVFQDVTAVPFVVIIPVLGAGVGAAALAGALGWALAKAVMALLLVFFLGRWLLRPLFHIVAERRSTEVFTLTVLFVSLVAGWVTHNLGLSMAFGAFLAGMVLGETEFRHQVESTIRPFRDVLLGLFFIAIGMLFDPLAIPQVWHWALAGALALMLVKIGVVALIARHAGIEAMTAWRTGLLLAVGGEFGLALVAIALPAGVVDERIAQALLTAVLFSMAAAPFLIRHNRVIARMLAPGALGGGDEPPAPPEVDASSQLTNHVIVCGYGRIGQNVGAVLERERIPFVALDLDAERVRQALAAGEPVFYGDAAERDMLEATGIDRARLVVISHDDLAAALKALHHIRVLRPGLPVMVRTRDETHIGQLREAGATEVVPETLEAGLMIAIHALLLLDIPAGKVLGYMQSQRSGRYRLLRELFHGDQATAASTEPSARSSLHPIPIPAGSAAAGRTIGELPLDGLRVNALCRQGERILDPAQGTRIDEGDVLVLFGTPEDIARAERALNQ
ncbi:MAG: cation:proton antiporter [Rehaibacterium terrae]|uniref:cation:proton antiporter domain-containing protein n=1 Tax=Rehaibacterium terrae TaxID=1341696 RepID=UPI00391DB6A5